MQYDMNPPRKMCISKTMTSKFIYCTTLNNRDNYPPLTLNKVYIPKWKTEQLYIENAKCIHILIGLTIVILLLINISLDASQ